MSKQKRANSLLMARRSLLGKKVLITAGPTREYWDPVRYFTNASSGAMGTALANEAARLGARVTLVMGPVPEISVGKKVRVVPVVSAWDMYQAVRKHLPDTHVFVGAAAVVDYRPSIPLKQKIKRVKPSLTLQLHGNPDIISMVGHLGRGRPVCVLGFALETDHLLENARKKLLRKRLDWVLANRESNMGQSEAAGTLLSRWGERLEFSKMTKTKLAGKIWQAIVR
jgi:phosphopantothenoylcysteine decarboxylase / phosphopantothenate---cysteine ligase